MSAKRNGNAVWPVSKDKRGARGAWCFAQLPGFSVLTVLSLTVFACRPDPGGARQDPTSEQRPDAAAGKAGNAASPTRDDLVARKDELPELSPQLQPWFQDERGLEALRAERRGKDAEAQRLLKELAQDPSARSEDRGGAELLLAVRALDRGDSAAAARAFTAIWSLPAFRPIAGELVAMGASAWLDASMVRPAGQLLDDAKRGGVSSPALDVLRAQVYVREANEDAALKLYAEVAKQYGGQWADQARVESAEILLASSDPAKRDQAKALLDDVQSADLVGALSRQAARLRALLSPGAKPDVSARSSSTSANAIAEIERLYRSRSYRSAQRAADRQLRTKRKKSPSDACELYYWKGSALFKLRDRVAATQPFLAGAKACSEAGNRDLEVKCRFQGARGIFAQGKFEDAAHAFESLSRDHRDHSYADDALIYAGEAWEAGQDAKRAHAVYGKVLEDFPSGDMREEARRRMLLLAFTEARLQEVESLVTRSLASGEVHGDEHAKLLYFRGRARARSGNERGAQEDYIQAVRLRPLSYAALHAWSRLREAGSESWEAELRRSLIDAPVRDVPPMDLPVSESAARALVWAQVGVRDRARAALQEAGIEGWPAVATLALAGDWFESQRSIARMRSDWRHVPPKGAMRSHWELAHPLPFKELVLPKEQASELPALLSFAIMQTESRFDPSQTSWAGARGLMQLMPGTAEFIARKLDLGKPSNSQLHDPDINIRLGVYNLSSLVERFGGVDASVALAIPGYNAGPGNVDKWLAQRGDWDLDLFIEAIPFDETRHYTQSVLGRWIAYRWIYGGEDLSARIPYLPLKIPTREQQG